MNSGSSNVIQTQFLPTDRRAKTAHPNGGRVSTSAKDGENQQNYQSLSRTVRVWNFVVQILVVAATLLAISVLLGIFGVMNWECLNWLVQTWLKDENHAHGIAVPFFSLGLLCLRRKDSPRLTKNFTVWSTLCASLLILLGCGLNAAGSYCRMITLEALAIIPGLAGIALCCGGWRMLRAAAPSILYLIFMIPLPSFLGDQLALELQRVATMGCTFSLQLLGVPAVADGNIIHLSQTQLGVAEACSGIRMLTAFFALATAFCLALTCENWKKVLLIVSAPVIAIVANVARITTIGLICEVNQFQHLPSFYHDLAGWLMMPVGFGLFSVELFLLWKVFPPDVAD